MTSPAWWWPAAKGTLHEPLMRERLKNARLITPDTPHAREQEVQAGRADVFMTDFPYTRRMLETTDWARLVAPTTVLARRLRLGRAAR